jgi:ACS family hexuronate transporter-like MFS transporter
VDGCPKRRGIAIGLATSGAAVGSVLAPPLTVGGRRTSAGAARSPPRPPSARSGCIAWLLAFRGLPVAATTRRRIVRASSWRALLGRVEVRRLLAARFCFDPVFYFYMFWIPQYLSKERGMSLAAIGALTWIPFVFLEIANIGAGHVSDRVIARGVPRRKARMTLMLVAALLTPASFLAALAGTPAVAIGLMAVLMFAHGIWITNFMALIGDTVESRDVATTVGLTGTCGGDRRHALQPRHRPRGRSLLLHPIFLASAVVYPLAWLILSGRVVFRSTPADLTADNTDDRG